MLQIHSKMEQIYRSDLVSVDWTVNQALSSMLPIRRIIRHMFPVEVAARRSHLAFGAPPADHDIFFMAT